MEEAQEETKKVEEERLVGRGQNRRRKEVRNKHNSNVCNLRRPRARCYFYLNWLKTIEVVYIQRFRRDNLQLLLSQYFKFFNFMNKGVSTDDLHICCPVEIYWKNYEQGTKSQKNWRNFSTFCPFYDGGSCASRPDTSGFGFINECL